MSATVVELRRRRPISKVTIKALKDMVNHIENAEIHSVAYVGIKRNGTVVYGYEGSAHSNLLGSLDLVKDTVLSDWKEIP